MYKELKQLNEEKQSLIRLCDKGEITEGEFSQRNVEIENKINSIVKEVIIEHQNKLKIKQEESKKMVEEKQDNKTNRVPRENSLASLAAKALLMKTVKSVEQAVEKMKEWGAKGDDAKLTARVKVVISEVKKQKQARWKQFKWNEEEFLLTEA